MSSRRPRHAMLLSPLTLNERVAVGETFFRRCFSIALNITMVLAAVAMLLALLNPRTSAGGTIVIAALVAVAARAGPRATRYEWLRRYPYALVLGGPLTAVSSLGPAVDANALYFPALAPLALIACVAQRRRERIAVIVSVAIGTLAAAVLDTHSPNLSSPEALTGATVGVAYLGVLLGVVIDWCARRVLLAPDGVDADASPIDAPAGRTAVRPALANEIVPEEGRRLARIQSISLASNDEITRVRPESLSRLTARELQILFLVGEGLDRHDVADSLCISPKTVDKHIQHVRDKTGLTGTGRPTSWLALDLPPFRPPAQTARALARASNSAADGPEARTGGSAP
ncbi:MAG: hypothetical protein QOD53_389 [Thermoleophilaceae bacterium]|nr:hypothetical protein [Thermoleophilaceae bacterium]